MVSSTVTKIHGQVLFTKKKITTKDKLWNFKISFSTDSFRIPEAPSSAAGQTPFPSQSCQGQPIPSLTVVLDRKRNNRMANAQYDRGNQTLFHPEDPPMANLRRVAFVMMSFVDNYTSPLARNPHDTIIGFLLVQQWWFSFERRSTPAPDGAECCLYRNVLKTTDS